MQIAQKEVAVERRSLGVSSCQDAILDPFSEKPSILWPAPAWPRASLSPQHPAKCQGLHTQPSESTSRKKLILINGLLVSGWISSTWVKKCHLNNTSQSCNMLQSSGQCLSLKLSHDILAIWQKSSVVCVIFSLFPSFLDLHSSWTSSSWSGRKMKVPCSPSWCPRAEGCLPKRIGRHLEKKKVCEFVYVCVAKTQIEESMEKVASFEGHWRTQRDL